MKPSTLINAALQTLSCTQKVLAAKLGVSPTQISKWKKDEHMSDEMEKKVRKLANIEKFDSDLLRLAGSEENAQKWLNLITVLGEAADDNAETGYNTPYLIDEPEALAEETLSILEQMGFQFPETLPDELLLSDEPQIDSMTDEFWDDIEDSPIAALITSIYRSYTDVYGYYVAYIDKYTYDDRLDLEDLGQDVRMCLLELAATKLEDVDPAILPGFANFKRETCRFFEKALRKIKDRVQYFNVPLRANIMDLVYEGHDGLGHEAEAESLGVIDRRLHPDIHMNELLIGMRAIHQVLPAILEKLEIKFEIDPNEFHEN